MLTHSPYSSHNCAYVDLDVILRLMVTAAAASEAMIEIINPQISAIANGEAELGLGDDGSTQRVFGPV